MLIIAVRSVTCTPMMTKINRAGPATALLALAFVACLLCVVSTPAHADDAVKTLKTDYPATEARLLMLRARRLAQTEPVGNGANDRINEVRRNSGRSRHAGCLG